MSTGGHGEDLVSGNPKAGWYVDSADPTLLRYWDATRWTDDRQLISETPQPSVGRTTKNPRSTVDDLLIAAWSGVKATFGSLAGVTLVFMLATVLYTMAISFVLDGSESSGLVLLLVNGPVLGATTIWLMMVSRLLQQHHRYQPIQISEAWAKTKQRFWPTFLVVALLSMAWAFLDVRLTIRSIAVALIVWLAIAAVILVKFAFIFIAGVATAPGDPVMSASTQISTGRFFATLGRLLIVAVPLIALYIVVIASFVAAASFGVVLLAIPILWFGWMIFFSGVVRIYTEER